MRKIKNAKKKHRIENMVLRIIIWFAFISVVAIVAGLVFGAYLCGKYGL